MVRTGRTGAGTDRLLGVVHFPQGLPGFEQAIYFSLSEPPGQMFVFLQSVGGPSPVAFAAVDPFRLQADYRPILGTSDLKFLGLNHPDEVHLLCLAHVPRDLGPITVNLLSPLALNLRAGLGRQIVLQGARYPVRFALPDPWTAAAAGRMDQRVLAAS